MNVSRLTLGCWQFARDSNFPDMDEALSIRLIHEAFDGGITCFDTGEAYGKGYGEEVLGKALRQRGAKTQISTKVRDSNLEAGRLRQSVEASLRRLGREHIDFYFIHWPTAAQDMNAALEILGSLREEGKLGCVGVSNFVRDDLNSIRKPEQIGAIQFPYNLVWRAYDLELGELPQARRMTFFAYSPLAQGLLATGANPKRPCQHENILYREPALSRCRPALDVVNQLASDRGLTPAQISLAWVLSKPQVASAVIGATRSEQLAENLAAQEVVLAPAELKRLEEASQPMLEFLSKDADARRSMWGWWPDRKTS
jgi:myo-inositol catabolism protein IolS